MSTVPDVATVALVAVGVNASGGLNVFGDLLRVFPVESELALLNVFELIGVFGPHQGCGYFVGNTPYGSYASLERIPTDFNATLHASIGGPIIVTSASAGTLLETDGTSGVTYGTLDTATSYVNEKLTISIPADELAAFEVDTLPITLPTDLRIEDAMGGVSDRANIHSTIRWTPDGGGDVAIAFGYNQYDGGPEIRNLVCKVPNTGQFTLPDNIKSHIGEQFLANVDLTRSQHGTVRSGDSLLIWRRISRLGID